MFNVKAMSIRFKSMSIWPIITPYDLITCLIRFICITTFEDCCQTGHVIDHESDVNHALYLITCRDVEVLLATLEMIKNCYIDK